MKTGQASQSLGKEQTERSDAYNDRIYPFTSKLLAAITHLQGFKR
jgi:hypothetical protein